LLFLKTIAGYVQTVSIWGQLGQTNINGFGEKKITDVYVFVRRKFNDAES